MTEVFLAHYKNASSPWKDHPEAERLHREVIEKVVQRVGDVDAPKDWRELIEVRRDVLLYLKEEGWMMRLMGLDSSIGAQLVGVGLQRGVQASIRYCESVLARHPQGGSEVTLLQFLQDFISEEPLEGCLPVGSCTTREVVEELPDFFLQFAWRDDD